MHYVAVSILCVCLYVCTCTCIWYRSLGRRDRSHIDEVVLNIELCLKSCTLSARKLVVTQRDKCEKHKFEFLCSSRYFFMRCSNNFSAGYKSNCIAIKGYFNRNKTYFQWNGEILLLHLVIKWARSFYGRINR